MKNVVTFLVKFLFSLWLPLELYLWFFTCLNMMHQSTVLSWFFLLRVLCTISAISKTWAKIRFWGINPIKVSCRETLSNGRLRASENPFLHKSTNNSAKWPKSTFFWALQINENPTTVKELLFKKNGWMKFSINTRIMVCELALYLSSSSQLCGSLENY